MPPFIPVVGSPPGVSSNPPDAETRPCRACKTAIAFASQSIAFLDATPQAKPFCFGCAARMWPHMEIAGSEGYVWTWVEVFEGVSIGQIRVGPITIRQYMAGARPVK